MQNRINLVQNDTAPDLTIALYDPISNSPIDVSGATVVRLYFRPSAGGALKTLIATKPSGGADGVVSFIWSAGDLATAGDHEGEVEITFASGKIQTVPEKLLFYVREQIA